MAANDPGAPQARKPHLSAEAAEEFASQIRPSWELLDFDGQIPDLGVPIESAALKAKMAVPSTPEAPPAGATASDTIIDGVPTFPVSGSGEAVSDGPIKPMPIAAIGTPADDVPVDEDIPVDALPLPPERIVIGGPPTRKSTMIGGVGPASESAPDQVPAAAAAAPFVAPGQSRAPASSRRAITPATPSPSRAGASRPGMSRPGVTGADDEIEIPIAGPSRGLFIKIGIGAGALIVLAIGLKVIFGGSDNGAGTTPATPAKASVAAVTAAPPATSAALAPTPPPPAPPATTAPVPSAAPVAPPTPTAVAKPEPPAPPPAKTAAPPPPAKTTPPAKTPPAPPKKGGGLIRETPF